jgi:hypothetical protein
VGGAVAVPCRNNFDKGVVGKLFAQHRDFIEGVFVAEEGDTPFLCGEVIRQPDTKGRLSGTTGAEASDDNES